MQLIYMYYLIETLIYKEVPSGGHVRATTVCSAVPWCHASKSFIFHMCTTSLFQISQK